MLSRIDIFRKYIAGLDDMKIVVCSREELENINAERQMLVAAVNCQHNTIIICRDDATSFSDDELDIIMLHEIAHYKLHNIGISGYYCEEESADKLAVRWFVIIHDCSMDVAYATYMSAVHKTKELTMILRKKYGIPEDRPTNPKYDHRKNIW